LLTRVSIIQGVRITITLFFFAYTEDPKVLLEAPYRPGHLKNSALLTIDLTKAVADEAIARKDSIIITYRKLISNTLTSFTEANRL
jgi:hypothetical protein